MMGLLKITAIKHLSRQYLRAADQLNKLALETEKSKLDENEQNNDFIYFNYKTYVISSIFNTIAFLEASINEFYIQVAELDSPSTENEIVRNRFKDKWNNPNFERRSSMLIKYNTALELYDANIFQYGDRLISDIKYAIDLRNALTHYKTVYYDALNVDNNSNKTSSLEKEHNNRFELNPFKFYENSAFFPDRVLSYSCANWSLKTSIQFTIEFYNRLQLPYPNSDLLELYDIDFVNNYEE